MNGWWSSAVIRRRERAACRRASAAAAASLLAVAAPAAAVPVGAARSAIARPARSFAPLRVAVIGDFGTGAAAQRAVARRMCRWRRHHPFRNVITTGDNVYPDGARARFRRAFFRPYSCLLRTGVRWHASLGNHDHETARGAPELRSRAFGMPARNYVWHKDGVRFVIVDSNRIRLRWIARATRPAAEDRWTVVVFHHPVFSPGFHGSTPGFRPSLPRVFRRNGVDLVLNGHDHIYSVTKRLRGIRYVVTGGGGAPLYGCSKTWFTRTCRATHHFLYVALYRNRIWVKAIPATGPPFALFSTTGRGPSRSASQ